MGGKRLAVMFGLTAMVEAAAVGRAGFGVVNSPMPPAAPPTETDPWLTIAFTALDRVEASVLRAPDWLESPINPGIVTFWTCSSPAREPDVIWPVTMEPSDAWMSMSGGACGSVDPTGGGALPDDKAYDW